MGLFLISDRDLRPRLSSVKLSTVRLLGRSGWLFFVLGIAAAVGYQSDALVISVRLGANRVPEYVLPFRLFSLIPTFLGFFVLPLWATHAESLQRGEAERVRRTLRLSLMLSAAIATVASIILVFVSPAVIRLWAGPSVPTPSLGLLCCLALLAIALGLSGPIAMLLNGADVIGFQVAVASLMMVVNLVLSIALVVPIGVAGPPLATALAQVFCVLLPCAVYTRRLFDQHRLPAGPVLQQPVVT
jgi:O-antigen/teichoic acid export membrane protein